MYQGWVRLLWLGVIIGEIGAEEERCSRHKHQQGACSMNRKERNPCILQGFQSLLLVMLLAATALFLRPVVGFHQLCPMASPAFAGNERGFLHLLVDDGGNHAS